jgi:hypothetical protein
MAGVRPLTWDPDDKERTALHEAGHAVLAWSFGVTVGCIHLDVENESGHTTAGLTAHLKPVEQIANRLAGFEAEQVFKPPGKVKRAWDDFLKVREILEENGTPEDTPEGQKLDKQGRVCAEMRLRKHETKVRRIAHHLVKHHYMDRVVFEAMMQEPVQFQD